MQAMLVGCIVGNQSDRSLGHGLIQVGGALFGRSRISGKVETP